MATFNTGALGAVIFENNGISVLDAGSNSVIDSSVYTSALYSNAVISATNPPFSTSISRTLVTLNNLLVHPNTELVILTTSPASTCNPE